MRSTDELKALIYDELFALKDEKYGDFNAKLIPNIAREDIIGVRMPKIRELAKKLDYDEAAPWFDELPHRYLEENTLQGIYISGMKSRRECLERLEQFLPFVDNWAVCDTMNPKILSKDKSRFIGEIKSWIKSKHIYTARFGIGMLMRYFLDDDFKDEYLDLVSELRSEEYYLNMMIAWYFATALAKQWDAASKYIKEQKLSKWTHNKAVQKAIESRRLTTLQKEYLRKLKIK
ncbi:MAG: DNA alkylation repair protein [Eubacterium sp.]|nr:DNA alkylation repair protein [Eubacterium sp.]